MTALVIVVCLAGLVSAGWHGYQEGIRQADLRRSQTAADRRLRAELDRLFSDADRFDR